MRVSDGVDPQAASRFLDGLHPILAERVRPSLKGSKPPQLSIPRRVTE